MGSKAARLYQQVKSLQIVTGLLAREVLAMREAQGRRNAAIGEILLHESAPDYDALAKGILEEHTAPGGRVDYGVKALAKLLASESSSA